MNMHRLPTPQPQALPVTSDPHGLDLPYRGGGIPEFPQREGDLRGLLVRYLGLALKYKLLIAACCLAALFLGFVVTYLTPKTYMASTTVKIDRAPAKVLTSQRDDGASYDPTFLQTQFELIKSRSLAERVVTSLNLGQTDFVGGRPSLWARLLGRTAPPTDAVSVQARHEAAIGQVMEGISVQPVPFSSIVRIRFAGPDPAWAQRISVAAAEQYERSIIDRRFSVSQHARAFLDERLQQLKVKLQESEKQLIAYAQQHGIVNVDDKQPAAAAALQAVQDALAAATTERLKKEQLWQVAQGGNVMALPQVMGDKLIQSARERLGTLQATYQDKLNVLKPAFPEMVALRSQMSEAEKQIKLQVELVRETTRREFEVARAQEIALLERLEEVKSQVLDLRGRSVEYTILLREVDTARSLYEGLLQQFRELAVVGEVDTNNVSIIDRAQLGGQISPVLSLNLLIALALGLLGSAAIVTVREVLDDTFKSPEDVEEALGLSVLGVAPKQPAEAGAPVHDAARDLTSPLAEAYRSLRTALQFSTEEGAPRSILVTSSRPGEGKSTTSSLLALNFGQLGMRVLLIDADLRNPSLHKVFVADNSAGLSNYLAGAAEATQLVQESSIPNVTLMPTGPLPPNPAELLAGPRFANLLSAAAETFDVVIVDGPPVMGLADAPIIASVVGGTLLVIEAATTRRGVVRDAAKRLHFARARMLGALLNKFDPQATGYAYGYGGNYGYGANYYGYGGQETKKLPAEA